MVWEKKEMVPPSKFPSKINVQPCHPTGVSVHARHLSPWYTSALMWLSFFFNYYFNDFLYIYIFWGGPTTPFGPHGGGQPPPFWPRGWLRPFLGVAEPPPWPLDHPQGTKWGWPAWGWLGHPQWPKPNFFYCYYFFFHFGPWRWPKGVAEQLYPCGFINFMMCPLWFEWISEIVPWATPLAKMGVAATPDLYIYIYIKEIIKKKW
jgi:hypothetical protein